LTPTNIARYAHATTAEVTTACDGDRLVVTIRDDGVGGAAPAPGSGLAGLEDRVAALGGSLAIASPPRHGTTVRAEVPVS
jgi:signal transduction histidine kinase